MWIQRRDTSAGCETDRAGTCPADGPGHSGTRIGRTGLILAALAAAACGGDDGGGLPTMPLPEDPIETPTEEPPTTPPGAPEVKGMAVYAVDLANRLLIFGTESTDQISHMVDIEGVPLLYRIVGIDFRPSDGRLYGVGNDSRVYVLDWETGQATPVSAEPFTPKIARFFDVHFGMGFDPVQDKIRLIAAESGGNWLIDPDDGTAVLENNVRYADGDPHAGRKPRILGLTYVPPNASGAFRVGLERACEDLMYAIDADLAEYIGSCDVKSGDFDSMGPLPELTAIARCGELKFDHGPGNLWLVIQRGAERLNSMGSVDPETGWIHWTGDVPDPSPAQGIAFGPAPEHGSMRAPTPEMLNPAFLGGPGRVEGDGGVPCPGT